ncbi:MAG: SLC13 family permease [Burkholderiaceae bacterium]
MTPVVVVLVLSLIAYASNRISLQSISLAVICSLAVIYGLDDKPDDGSLLPAFSGFASEALVAIVGLMVLGKTLMMSGALRPVAALLSGALTRVPRLAFIAVLAGGLAISGFLNDTPVVVMLLPILLGATAQIGRPAGGMLLPMNYAVILGGMMTAIGTSTNLLVNGLSADNGGPRFGFFDFYLITLPTVLLGLAYLVLVAPRLLRGAGNEPRQEAQTRFLVSLRIDAESPLIDKPIYALRKRLPASVTLRHLMRNEREIARFPTVALRADDRLVLSGTAQALHEFSDDLGLEPAAGGNLLLTPGESDEPGDLQRRQCVVSAGSPLIGRTVRGSGLEWRFDLRVVGLSEFASDSRVQHPSDLPHMPIRAGDTLLLEGTEEQIGRAAEMLGLLAVGQPLLRRAGRDSKIALAIFAAVVVAAVFKILPISVAAATGVLLTVAFGVMRWEDVESAVEWRIVLIVASSIALGDALVRSGAMEYLAGQISAWAGAWPRPLLLGLIMSFTGLLTNFVSNNAAAAIMTPLTLALARNVGAPLEPFVLAVLFGANLCFLTPFAYQTNLLVMAAAGYRFNDFLKVGIPLFALCVPTLTATLAAVYF